MPRIPVNSSTVQTYLQEAITAKNYQLFYGLNLLSDSQFQQVMDALLNGDCQPEELVRLGTFTSSEADTFIQDVLGNWTSPGVATPQVGTDGYTYLTNELGLTTMLQLVANPPVTTPGPDPAQFLGVSYAAGGSGSSYASSAAINAIFEADVIPSALGTTPYNAVFPSGAGDVSTYILANVPDSGAQALVQSWYAGIFAPLTGVAQSDLGTTLFAVNNDPTIPFRANPGLAQWVLAEPEVPPMAHLLLLREAAVRTSVGGPYAKGDVDSRLSAQEALSPGTVATSRTMAGIYFWNQVLEAVIAENLGWTPEDADWLAYKARADSLNSAYNAITTYRQLLRGFLLAAYNGAAQYIQGSYPAG